MNIISSSMPLGIDYQAGISAQLKSAVILAGLNSYGTSTVIEEKESRDHTENILLENAPNVLSIKKNKKNKI